MVCFYPQKLYWTGEYTDLGKKRLVPEFYWNNYRFGPLPKEPETLAGCGKCIGCRMNNARSNAVRICDDASLFKNNCFITLTVGDEWKEHIFPGSSVLPEPFQLFAKRLRKRFDGYELLQKPSFIRSKKWNDYPIRIIFCAEYGSIDWRPHFHAILMNFDFGDKEQYGYSNNGSPLYVSQSLMELWSDPVTGRSYGRCDIGDVNNDSSAYLAGYSLKKQEQIEVWTDDRYKIIEIEPEKVVDGSINLGFNMIPGRSAEQIEYSYTVPARFKRVDTAENKILRLDTGEILNRPFVKYPTHFGLGRLWYQQYGMSDIYNDDRAFFGGKFYPVPRYFDKKMEQENPDFLAEIKAERKEKAIKFQKSDEELKRLEQVFLYRQQRKEAQKKI